MKQPDTDHTCVLTIQADRPGGVPTVIDWWHAYLTGWGHQATTLYAAFEGGEISRWERIRLTLRNWRVHDRPEHPNPTIANAPLPLPLWAFYFMPQWIFGPVLDSFDQVVVAGGPCHAALPLALRGFPYVIWMGTVYEDELRGKVLAGDQWAGRVLNGPFWPFLVWQEKLVLRRASRILAQSPYTQRRIGGIVPEAKDKLDLVMVPIDLDRFHPTPDQAPYPYLLTVGRLNDPRKNTPMLLEAFAQVRAAHPDLKLVMVGDDPAAFVVDQCERLGISEAVEFKGKVVGDELVRLYQQATLFVMASAQEGLGIVMLEAMACGAPVVATDCGGPEGIVLDGQTGQIVPNNDAKALAEAINRLLSDPEALKVMRENCKNFIQEHASREVVERQLYAHFSDTFPESDAAKKKLFEYEPIESAPVQSERLWSIIAAGWAVFVFAVYIHNQLRIHWPAIQNQLLGPLFR